MKCFHANQPTRFGIAFQLMALVLFYVGSKGAWAAASCVGEARVYEIYFPTSISVPRDAPVGTLLTPWKTTAGSVQWTCTVTNAYLGAAATTSAYNQASGVTTTYNGATVSVYKTNVAGVGIALAHRDLMGVSWKGWLDLKNYWYGGWWGNWTTGINWGVQVVSALVKTDAIAATGRIPAVTVAQTAVVTTREGGGPADPASPVPNTLSYHNIAAPISIVPLSCTVPDVAVDLGEVATAGFKGVGSSAGNRNFNFNLNNCPAGMRSVSLQVHPTNGILAGTVDVAKLNANSSAKGVGVKLQWANGNPLTLDAKSQVADYQGQAISIPLKWNAAYYQADKIIQPGTANASFEVTLFYE
ncbi:fimbrial protein [Dyella choica]|uniref:Type 1 fimbrial protein n=1 Tax=Dyella choica TaxID=1927959 RepID=A0A3S0WXK4_9GAMM|nr:fimbrial protein [Dyella choica]RUL78238.1 type 1 fimbrial protein [Dyella choica]